MAIGALARAGVRLGDQRLIESARWAAERVLEDNSGDDGMLRRASLDEIVSRAPAAREDWGLLADGLFALAAATGEVAYAVRARELIDDCFDADGRVVLPGGGDPVLRAQGVVAPVDDSDGASPSGLAALASAALSAWLWGAGERYRCAAATIVADAAASALAQPLSSGAMLRVAASLASAPRQVVVVSEVRDSPLAEAGARLPADLFAVATPAQARRFADAGFTLFEGKDAPASGSRAAATLYDCRDFVCRLPVTDPALLAE